MSQEKVDKKRELKAHRKDIAKAKKFKTRLAGIITAIVCLALVVWLGYSAYGKITAGSEENVSKTPINTSALTDYMDSLQDTAEDTE